MLLEEVAERGGADWTDLAEVTRDRRARRGLVKMQMKRLDEWEQSQGHKWMGDRVERNEVRGRGQSLIECGVCGKVRGAEVQWRT